MAGSKKSVYRERRKTALFNIKSDSMKEALFILVILKAPNSRVVQMDNDLWDKQQSLDNKRMFCFLIKA